MARSSNQILIVSLGHVPSSRTSISLFDLTLITASLSPVLSYVSRTPRGVRGGFASDCSRSPERPSCPQSLAKCRAFRKLGTLSFKRTEETQSLPALQRA
eukprot:631447-Prymnesium_polylepis.1